MKVLFGLIAMLAMVAMWACGVGVAVSVIMCILKLCGASFAATVSYWLPLKFVGGWLVSLCIAGVASAGVVSI